MPVGVLAAVVVSRVLALKFGMAVVHQEVVAPAIVLLVLLTFVAFISAKKWANGAILMKIVAENLILVVLLFIMIAVA